MSDINRVPIPYGSQTISNKSKNVTKKTVRIAVKLPQSNEDTCPEYNYKDELDAAKKKESSKSAVNGKILDIFEDDDGEDVRRIAMQMEEKYGKGVAVSKKRRLNRKDDYADIGMGYDESDSFIDNTDGYDEIIPQNVTTLHGGFYINCGALEFKTDDEASENEHSSSPSSASSSPKCGKRDGDSAGDSEDEIRRSKKFKSEHNGMQKSLKKKLFNANQILKKKRSSVIHKKVVKDLLKEKRKYLDLSVKDSDADQSVLEDGDENLENNKKSLNSITDAIESVVKAVDDPASKAESKNRLSSQTIENSNKLVQLPESLPNNISEVINKIKQMASNFTGGSNFTDEMNNLLLSLEKKCKCLGKPSKTKVYEHLSYFMKIEKTLLMQHCNQLALKDEEKKIKSLIQKLKLEIDKVMPSIVTNYEKECELVLEKRTLLQQQFPDDNEKRRSIGRPKRKFRWNDQTKKYLKDTAVIKRRSFLQQGNSKENWEAELTNFLKKNVLHLWPEGWMTMTTLTKVCNKLFSDIKTLQSSMIKKEMKITASNANNVSTTSVMPNVHDTMVIPKIENVKEVAQENNSDKNTFYKIEFEKAQSVPSSSFKLIEESPEIKDVPNVNLIELDDLSPIQKTKIKSFDFGLSLLKNVQQKESPGSCSREIPVMRNDKKEDAESAFIVPPSDSDDIQKVMEHLRNLQEMSSPVKSFGSLPPQKNSSVIKNNTIDLVNSSFQDEFQKQLYAISNLTPNSSKNYKCS